MLFYYSLLVVFINFIYYLDFLITLCFHTTNKQVLNAYNIDLQRLNTIINILLI